MKDTTFRTK